MSTDRGVPAGATRRAARDRFITDRLLPALAWLIGGLMALTLLGCLILMCAFAWEAVL